jgi:hypothetical protein
MTSSGSIPWSNNEAKYSGLPAFDERILLTICVSETYWTALNVKHPDDRGGKADQRPMDEPMVLLRAAPKSLGRHDGGFTRH